jgi:invasion protein IalB
MPFDLNNNTTRAVIAAVVLVIGFFAGYFVHKAVSTPQDVPVAMQYDDWRLACPKLTEKDAGCELLLDVWDDKHTQLLSRLQIGKPKEGTTMLVTVPFNTLLDAGMGLQFGNDKPRLYKLEYCDEVGCVARIPFTDDIAKAMTASQSPRILVAGLDNKAAGLPFSLKGFAAAYKAFLADEGKRHSWWKRLWS